MLGRHWLDPGRHFSDPFTTEVPVSVVGRPSSIRRTLTSTPATPTRVQIRHVPHPAGLGLDFHHPGMASPPSYRHAATATALSKCRTGPPSLPLGNNRHECRRGELERDGNSALSREARWQDARICRETVTNRPSAGLLCTCAVPRPAPGWSTSSPSVDKLNTTAPTWRWSRMGGVAPRTTAKLVASPSTLDTR